MNLGPWNSLETRKEYEYNYVKMQHVVVQMQAYLHDVLGLEPVSSKVWYAHRARI